MTHKGNSGDDQRDAGGDGSPPRIAWKVSEWCRLVSVCRSTCHNLRHAGAIESVKVGTTRLITTAPQDFIKKAAVANPLKPRKARRRREDRKDGGTEGGIPPLRAAAPAEEA